MASLWRIQRFERHPELDPDPTTGAVRIVLRDASTGLVEVKNVGVPLATLADKTLLTAWICTTYNATYAPNDFGCPPG